MANEDWRPGMEATDNEQCVRNIMNYSAHGGLVQAFVMIALDDYAQAVMKGEIVGDPESKSQSGFGVSQAKWKEIAEEVHGKLEQFYRRTVKSIAAPGGENTPRAG